MLARGGSDATVACPRRRSTNAAASSGSISLRSFGYASTRSSSSSKTPETTSSNPPERHWASSSAGAPPRDRTAETRTFGSRTARNQGRGRVSCCASTASAVASSSPRPARLEQLRDRNRGPRGAVRIPRQVVPLSADLLGDRPRDLRRPVGVEVHDTTGAVTLEPVAHVEVLLEVVPEWEGEERPPVRGQLHCRRQAALHDRKVACGQVPVEVVHVRPHLERVGGRQRPRVDARPGDHDHPQLGDELLRLGKRRYYAPEQIRADAGAADRDQTYRFVHAVAQLGPQTLAVAELRRVEARDVAGKGEVALGPVADPRQLGPEAVRDDVVGRADE